MGECAHPGCGATLWSGNRSGLCRRHYPATLAATRGPCTNETRKAISEAQRESWAKDRERRTEACRLGVKRWSESGGRPPSILTKLTPQERNDYTVLMRHNYRRAEALAAIGRGDLIP